MEPFSVAPRPTSSAVPTLLTIAGHDPSSGAGITADLKTFAAHGFFGTSAITALTVQSTLGVAEVHAIQPHLLRHTLEHLCADLPPAGIKIGMLGSAETASVVSDFLQAFLSNLPTPRKGTQHPLPVVLDPVLRSSSGATLLPPQALDVLHSQLIPHVSWITPNWSELSALTGLPVSNFAEAEASTLALARRHPHLHVVATAGGHSHPTDILRQPSGETHAFLGEHIPSTSTHGTGCAFSSSLLSRLVLGDTPTHAVRSAKNFVADAIRRAPSLGHGNGPLNLTAQPVDPAPATSR